MKKIEKLISNKKIRICILISIFILVIGVIFFVYETIINNQCETEVNINSHLYDDPIDKKPVIYLYPKEEIELLITLENPENITCSYPHYNNGWNIIANPDGTMIDKNTGRKLYSLYWEGIQKAPITMKDGFVVKREDTIKFLEDKLFILGLNELESEEFIIYWLPKLQENEYNFIRFATIDEINDNMPIDFSIEPDTFIRVLMEYKPLDNFIDVREQKLEVQERVGFVAVEWGGVEIS